MTESFLAVSQQVLILFILMAVGFFLSKLKKLTDESVKSLAFIALYIVTPCVIIQSFDRDFDPDMLRGLGLSVLAAAFTHVLCILIAKFAYPAKARKNGATPDENRWRVLRFGTIFCNCGYMAIPLQQAVLGPDGVFYGAAYIAVFNLFAWTYGLTLIAGDKEKFTVGKILLNPGIIAVFLGVALFISPIRLPSLVAAPVGHLAALNTPVPMLIIGHYLAGITSLKILKDKQFILHLFLRLLASPLISLVCFRLAGLSGIVLSAMIIAASAPTGANTAMFAVLYGRDEKLAVTMVSVSTLFSILTMPLVVTLSMMV